MRANISAFLPAIGLCGRLPVLSLDSGAPSQEQSGQDNDVPAGAEVGETDVYMVAILLLAGAAILTLF